MDNVVWKGPTLSINYCVVTFRPECGYLCFYLHQSIRLGYRAELHWVWRIAGTVGLPARACGVISRAESQEEATEVWEDIRKCLLGFSGERCGRNTTL